MSLVYDKIEAWALKYGNSIKVKAAFAGLALFEAFILPMPPDVLLPLFMFSEFRRRWLQYALITAAASVSGAVIGYIIGSWFFGILGAKIISFYGFETEFARAEEFFSTYTFATVFFGAFTPFPYQVITLSAGLFNVNFALFLIASITGRTLRYTLGMFLVKEYGLRLFRLISRNFAIATFAFIIILALLEYLGVINIIR